MRQFFFFFLAYILVFIGFVAGNNGTSSAYGMWFPLSPEDLMEKSGTIFVGTVTAVATVDVEYQSGITRDGTQKDSVGHEVMTLEEYAVSVEEYLKNPQDSDTMKVLSATVGGVPGGPSRISGFEIGDRVMFYLPKDEEQTHFANQYLPESFSMPEHCDAKAVLAQPKIDGANDFRMMQDGVAMQDNFAANKKIQFVFDRDMRTLDGAGFYVDVAISKILDKKERQTVLQESIRVESKPCEWIATAQWDFVPTAGEYAMWMRYGEEGDTGYATGGSNFSVVESFDFEYFTGEVFQINYELENAELQELTNDKNIKFVILSTDGKLSISFPKAVPLGANEGLDYPVFVAYYTGGGYSPELEKNTQFVQTASDCAFDIELDFNNISEQSIVIEINQGMYPEGPQLTYVDVPKKCLEDDPRNDTEIQRILDTKECLNASHHKGINMRDEAVCISTESYPWLNQRGYMKTFPIIS